jgi:hypothetical protein
MQITLPAALLLAGSVLAPADEPPVIEHQPIPCAVAGHALSICAGISDDVQVARARLYFRAERDKHYGIVDMVFGGINYCATLPAVKKGKTRAIEYYVHAVDDQYQAQRTSTFRMVIEPEGVCEFPPIEKDSARAASIRVYATNRKQGKKLSKAFEREGVTFIPKRK